MRVVLTIMCGVMLLACAEPAANGGTGGIDLCSQVHCDDGDDCTEDVCDPTDPRVCVFFLAPEETPCNGGGVCDGTGDCVECNGDQDCKDDDHNECVSPRCENKKCGGMAVADFTPCSGGACRAGRCEPTDLVLPCTEQGIRNAIAAGGGAYTFDCDGPTTVTTESEIVIDNDVILGGGGDLTVHGGNDHRVFSVLDANTVWLDGIAVSGGFAINSCGGLLNEGTLTLSKTVVAGNAAASGGGGLCNSGTITLLDSAVLGNSAKACAGVFNNGSLALINSRVWANTAAAGGGGICSSGTLTATSSTVFGNSANDAGGIESSGTLTLTNSTVSGNVAQERGGGIFNSGAATVTSSTVSGNTTGGERGDVRNAGSLTMVGTLVDGGCAGGIISGGYNVESPGDTCGFDQLTDQVRVTAAQLSLGTLGDNGGPTRTHPLLPGSVAIDAIPESACETAEDQRGVTRPQGDGCDVGSFEMEQP